MGPPPELALALRDALQLGEFVETGTLFGKTTLWAADLFRHVTTIEASRQHHEDVQHVFSSRDNIDSIFGDTGLRLTELIATLQPALFFLDAHWSGGSTAGEHSECPLLTELGVIMPWFRKHAIIIDDARLFMQPPTRPHKIEEWPSLDDIVRASNGAAYIFYYRDTLVLVPNVYRHLVSHIVRDLIPLPDPQLAV